jgi:SsrA-binding protein
MAMETKKHFQAIVNKKAYFDYTVIETVEAGVVLTGPEAKSIRLGQASMRESYVLINPEGAYIHHLVISAYKYARLEDYDSQQARKLLLHRAEIDRLRGVLQQQRVSLVPLKIYQKGRHFKVELGIVRGKKQYEKRETIKKRDIDREVEREMRGYKE